MRWRDVAALAAESLRVHRLRTRLTMAAIAIGVVAVLLLTALGDAAKGYVIQQFAAIGTNLIMVSRGHTETHGIPAIGGSTHDLTLEDAEAIARRAPAVRQVVPLAIGTAPFSYGGRVRPVVVAGTTPNLRTVRNLVVASGRFLPDLDPRQGSGVVVIGSRIQREVFRGENPLGAAVRIGDWRFRVIGVIAPRGKSFGMDFDDEAIVPVATALRMFDQTSLFRVLAQAREAAAVTTAQRQIHDVLKERHDGKEDFTLITQDAMLKTFGSIIDALTVALAGIAAISLAVAGIGIMNVMLVSVSERSREVGLLKALGARRSQILRVFLAEALLLSASGAAIGIAAGIGIVLLAAGVWPDLPLRPSPGWIAVVTALALSFGALFGLLPARRAARLGAAEALQGKR
jgi:putative ABC transport system permease protein